MSVSGYITAVGVVLQPQSSNIQVPTAGMQAAAAGQTERLILADHQREPHGGRVCIYFH